MPWSPEVLAIQEGEGAKGEDVTPVPLPWLGREAHYFWSHPIG